MPLESYLPTDLLPVFGDDEEGGLAEGLDDDFLFVLAHFLEAADSGDGDGEVVAAATAGEEMRVGGEVLIGEVVLDLGRCE